MDPSNKQQDKVLASDVERVLGDAVYTINEKHGSVSYSSEEQIPVEPPYIVFLSFERVLYSWLASVAAFASPVSTSIYYPVLTVLATDLNTSLANINLTITTFMVPYFSTDNFALTYLTLFRYSKRLLQHLWVASLTDGDDDPHIFYALPSTPLRIPVSLCRRALLHCCYFDVFRVGEAVAQLLCQMVLCRMSRRDHSVVNISGLRL